MANIVKQVFVPAFSASEIAARVAAVTLPQALDGIEVWHGSLDVGGNVAAHVATANGKAQTLGLCQLFSDFWFGSDSRANILKGLTNVRVRKAFDLATTDTIRLSRPLSNVDMLEFLKAFVGAALAMQPAKPIKAIKAEDKAEDKAETTPEQADNEIDSDALTAAIKDQFRITELEQALATMQAELMQAHEALAAVRTASTIKEVRKILTA